MNKDLKIIFILAFLLTTTLYCLTSYNSLGYDDEIFNVKLIEQTDSYKEINTLINSTDVHPAGMYLINKFLYNIIPNYFVIRAISGFFAAISLYFVWFSFYKSQTNKFILTFSFLSLCVNPTLLLWCTGLRWYTYYVPLICLLCILINKAQTKTYNVWAGFFIISLLMLYINYISFIICPIVFVCLIFIRKDYLKLEWKKICVFTILFFILASYQIYIFSTVHINNAGSQVNFLFNAFVTGGQNILCGQAVMPISAYGISLILAGLILFFIFLKNLKKCLTPLNTIFLIIYIGIMATGLGGKIRNFVILGALQGLFLTSVYEHIKVKMLQKAVLLLYAFGTIGGIFNVYLHIDTTKGSWNTPYKEIMEYIKKQTPNIKLVVSNNPVLLYYTSKAGIKTIDLNDKDWLSDITKEKGEILAIKSYRGSMTTENYSKYIEIINNSKIVEKKKFGYDKFARFKKRFDSSYPDYYAEAFKLEL